VTSVWRVAVRAHGDEAELLRARLLSLAPSGIEELDLDDGLELVVYLDEAAVVGALASLPNARVVPVDDGWEDAWRRFHRPVVVGDLWIGPPWERPPEPARAVVIDPGRAFGTGAHPTTRLCVELLAATETRGALLDVGCGSGVLSIAAARLGFDPVLAVDVDPVAVEATRANAADNGVVVETKVCDALDAELPRTDVAVANVLLRPIEAILARLEANDVITSGYLAGERPAHTGWAHVETVERDGWAADRFRPMR
jgi:ribosomal protein L11 methyltransferase